MSILERFGRRVRMRHSPIEFTVQIWHRNEKRIIGTGFIFQPEGKILTCAHVVCNASEEKIVTVGTKVRVRFRREKAVSVDKIEYEAKVIQHFHKLHEGRYYDDIVVLELINAPESLIDRKKMARLEPAYNPDENFDSRGNNFQSYGYSPVGVFASKYAKGIINGPVEGPLELTLCANPLELTSNEIERGMSGAAVIDLKRDRVVGLITHKLETSSESGISNKAYGADMKIVLLPEVTCNQLESAQV
ncbi:hypothetical protein Lepto7375DRAFT_6170 [Leptolyngbya sp. PCC 7375]|nr:hypothetical protein Lepto7375DRAFT_6170 [Leptolyngbya sp. PCC 7375]